jgi:hypothetical protein
LEAICRILFTGTSHELVVIDTTCSSRTVVAVTAIKPIGLIRVGVVVVVVVMVVVVVSSSSSSIRLFFSVIKIEFLMGKSLCR